MFFSFDRNEENKIKTLKLGDSFGELALLDNRPRAATIICDEDSYFAVLEKQLFDKILSKTILLIFLNFQLRGI